MDTWVETGTEVTPHYDSLLAKLMVHAPDRAGATAALQKALAATELGGIATNLDYVATIAGSQGFAAGAITPGSVCLCIRSSLLMHAPSARTLSHSLCLTGFTHDAALSTIVAQTGRQHTARSLDFRHSTSGHIADVRPVL